MAKYIERRIGLVEDTTKESMNFQQWLWVADANLVPSVTSIRLYLVASSNPFGQAGRLGLLAWSIFSSLSPTAR
jgi:hypothetical protein